MIVIDHLLDPAAEGVTPSPAPVFDQSAAENLRGFSRWPLSLTDFRLR